MDIGGTVDPSWGTLADLAPSPRVVAAFDLVWLSALRLEQMCDEIEVRRHAFGLS